MQAIAALKHIGSLVLFIVDKTEECGTSLQEQYHLLEEVGDLLEGREILVVTSKADVLDPRPTQWDEVSHSEKEWIEDGRKGTPNLPLLFDDEGSLTMSALENVGLDAMTMEIIRKVQSQWAQDPLELPEGWHRE